MLGSDVCRRRGMVAGIRHDNLLSYRGGGIDNGKVVSLLTIRPFSGDNSVNISDQTRRDDMIVVVVTIQYWPSNDRICDVINIVYHMVASWASMM